MQYRMRCEKCSANVRVSFYFFRQFVPKEKMKALKKQIRKVNPVAVVIVFKDTCPLCSEKGGNGDRKGESKISVRLMFKPQSTG